MSQQTPPTPAPGGRPDELPDRGEYVLTDPIEGQRLAERLVLSALARHRYAAEAQFAIRLALEEAVVNAFKHGSRGIVNPKVEFGFRVNDGEVMIRVKDPGPGFDPRKLPDPTAPENLERPGGRGVMLMKAFMTRIEYNAPGNQITMVYKRPG